MLAWEWFTVVMLWLTEGSLVAGRQTQTKDKVQACHEHFNKY